MVTISIDATRLDYLFSLPMIPTKLATSDLNGISKYLRPARQGLDTQRREVARLPTAIMGVTYGLNSCRGETVFLFTHNEESKWIKR